MWRQHPPKSAKQGHGRRFPFIAAFLAGALVLLGAHADSVTATVIHSFDASGSTAAGAYPYASLIQAKAADGNSYAYGTTYSGGTHNAGTIFIAGSSGTPAVIYNFGSNVTDGQNPRAGLVQGSDGNLYGTTLQGGTSNGGTVFKFNLSTGVLTTLHAFGSVYQDGTGPNSGLVQGNDGYLYGTTQSGGAKGSGTVYKISTSGTLTTLYSFGTITNTDTHVIDGSAPTAGLIQGSDGKLYGATSQGGTYSLGTVFSITLAGTYNSLYSFGAANSDGATPQSALIQGHDNNYYGTTEFGGANNSGTVYELSSSGTVVVLYSFGAATSDGTYPRGGLVEGSTPLSFYGTTQAGGADNLGTVYTVSVPIMKLSPGTSYVMPANAAVLVPANTTVTSNGGTPVTITGSDTTTNTSAGSTVNVPATATGAADNIVIAGTLQPSSAGVSDTVLYSFGTAMTGGTNTDGINPQVALLLATDGNLYGTTLNGGQHSTGTIFSITPSGQLSTLLAFGDTGAPGGSNPASGLLLGSDGNYYGTTQAGGANSLGTVYSISPGGTLKTIYTFGTTGSDGANPGAGLVQGSNGMLYGTTLNGGSSGYGTVFQLTTAGVLTTLHSFGNTASEGSNPQGRLAFGKDGNLYGVTRGGGAKFAGTVFMITPSGTTLKTLYSFGTASTDGSNPSAGLLLANDGSFYGTTFSGGTNSVGTVFNVTPSGALNTLFAFSSNNGANPGASLLLANDGNLYGTTQNGGANNMGAVFKVTIAGGSSTSAMPTTIYSFGSATGDGTNPEGELVQGKDGNLYGTTNAGGTNGKGTVFQITPGGQLNTIYAFGSNPNDAANPTSGLINGSSAGTLLGTTYAGGVNGTGTAYQITTASPGKSGGGAFFLSPLLLLMYLARVGRAKSARSA